MTVILSTLETTFLQELVRAHDDGKISFSVSDARELLATDDQKSFGAVIHSLNGNGFVEITQRTTCTNPVIQNVEIGETVQVRGRKRESFIQVTNQGIQHVRAADEKNTKRSSPPKKRGSRAVNIELLCDELTEHIRAAQDFAKHKLDQVGSRELLPRPTKKDLAQRVGIKKDNVTRCFQDESADLLRLLWHVAGDLDEIVRWTGPIRPQNR